MEISPTAKKRVLIVDDSVFARKIVSDMLSASPALEVVGTAINGAEALILIEKLQPDVITLDIEMPGIDGLETLKRIMAEHPTPVVMLSSLTLSGASESIQALSIGAVDIMAKPHGSHNLGMSVAQRDEIIGKVIAAADVRLSALLPIQSISRPQIQRKAAAIANFPVIAIASSTGGPRALRTIVPNLPTDSGAAYVIIQHLPEGFSGPLAKDLNNMTELNVRESSDGDCLNAGDLIFARAGYHTVFDKNSKIHLTTDPPLWGVRPSADITMISMVPVYGSRMIGAILTGMGHDGTDGVRHIKKAGGYTIAEHESSCVVYGMPRAAFESGYIDKVAPLASISDVISEAIFQSVGSAYKRRNAA